VKYSPAPPEEKASAEPAPLVRTVAAVAARFPRSVALSDGLTAYRYAELIEAVGAAAADLLELGVQAGDRVAVCSERGAAAIITMLAIAAVGACYVPLDGRRPTASLASALQKSSAALLVSGHPQAVAAANGVGTKHRTRLEHPRSLNPEEWSGRHGDAYLLFTSGTSGIPKGVVVGTQELATHIAGVSGWLALEPEDVTLQFMAASFDPSQQEIWTTLATGGHLVVNADPLITPEHLDRLMGSAHVTIAHLPTAYWRLFAARLCRAGTHTTCRDLRLMTVGGEKLPLEDVDRWFASHQFAHLPLVNFYGPTEAVIAATAIRLDRSWRAEAPGLGSAPTGHALPGHSVIVLNEGGRPANLGEVGEVYLGGTCLAVGYSDNPHDPAFVTADDGQRLYRTGDLGRLWPRDGLEIVGRHDDQVKINSQRVDLGEIEACLRGLAFLADCAVTIHQDVSNESRLVAHVVPTSPSESSGALSADQLADIRAHLRKTLPQFMWPRIIAYRALPLTPHGKTDREQLRRSLIARAEVP